MPGSVRRSGEHVLELPTAPDAVPVARALLRRVVGRRGILRRVLAQLGS